MNEHDVADLAWIPVILIVIFWVGRKADEAIATYSRMRDAQTDDGDRRRGRR